MCITRLWLVVCRFGVRMLGARVLFDRIRMLLERKVVILNMIFVLLDRTVVIRMSLDWSRVMLDSDVCDSGDKG